MHAYARASTMAIFRNFLCFSRSRSVRISFRCCCCRLAFQFVHTLVTGMCMRWCAFVVNLSWRLLLLKFTPTPARLLCSAMACSVRVEAFQPFLLKLRPWRAKTQWAHIQHAWAEHHESKHIDRIGFNTHEPIESHANPNQICSHFFHMVYPSAHYYCYSYSI